MVLEAIDALEKLDSIKKEMEEMKKQEEEEKVKEKVDLSEYFSRECSALVEVKGDEDNRTSESCVTFKGCKTMADQTILAISLLSTIVENMDREEAIDYLAHMCTMVIAGEKMGIYKTKEAMEQAEPKKEEEE